LHQYLNINGKPEERTKMARHVARMGEEKCELDIGVETYKKETSSNTQAKTSREY